MLNYFHRLKSEDRPQKLIMMVAFSSILNPAISITVLALFFIYLWMKDEVFINFEQPGLFRWTLIILAVSTALSVYFGNVIGYLMTLWFFLLSFFLSYCYRHLNYEMSDFILDHLFYFSIYLAFWGALQYLLSYFVTPNVLTSFTGIDNHRAVATFLNANYYSIMIQFFILYGVFKMIVEPTHSRWYYLIILFINLVALMLTGSRAGLGALLIAITVLVLLLIPKLAGLFLLAVGSIMIFIALFVPQLLVRFGSLAAGFLNRNDILLIGLARFFNNPFFGEGLFTISNVLHPLVRRIKTIHSHNLFLEPFINFGILPILLFFPFARVLRRVFLVIKAEGGSFYKLILAFIVMILIHGTVDIPFFFPPFLVLFSCLILGRTPRSAGRE